MPHARNGGIDLYYWYMATGAAYEIGGEFRREWNAALYVALVDSQRTAGSGKGSWDPAGAWGQEGGRVYATAINVLSLLQSVKDPKHRVFGTAR